jgi:hypothetical protein
MVSLACVGWRCWGGLVIGGAREGGVDETSWCLTIGWKSLVVCESKLCDLEEFLEGLWKNRRASKEPTNHRSTAGHTLGSALPQQQQLLRRFPLCLSPTYMQAAASDGSPPPSIPICTFTSNSTLRNQSTPKPSTHNTQTPSTQSNSNPHNQSPKQPQHSHPQHPNFPLVD